MEKFRRYLRMNTETFDELVHGVTPVIENQCTRLRKPLSVGEQFACTLHFLVTGESYSSLQYQFRISKSAISIFVPEVCSGIYMALRDEYLAFPKAEREWLDISTNIYKYWQFPNALWAMDGKHIAIFKPAGSSSLFYNFRFFLVLFYWRW